MTCTRSRSLPPDFTVSMLDGTHLEGVTSLKYLGIWLDDKLTFGVHIDSLLKKLRPKLVFFFFFQDVFFFHC